MTRDTSFRNFLICGILAATVGSVILFFGTGRRPKDATLVKQFQAHRPAFEELLGMLKADTRLYSVQDWGVSSTNHPIGESSFTEAGISKDRYDRYLSILRQSQTLSAIHDEDEFRFGAAASGWASKDYRIAITYRETLPTELLANLDDFKKTKQEWEQAYRKIEGNWYLWIIW